MHYIGKLNILLQLTTNTIFMKGFYYFLFIFLALFSCKTTQYVPPASRNTRAGYIAEFSAIAIEEMKRTGIPASIKMAQAILESGDGNSTLARRANNHFGIKCHDWTGRRIYHDDDERNECFRRYSHPEESFRDHSKFLTGRPRYAGLFNLDPYDYKSWARDLKAAGYATNPDYDKLLIRIIEDNSLHELDRGVVRITKPATSAGTPAAVTNTTSSGSARQINTRNRIKYIVARQGDNYESVTREMGLLSFELGRYNDIAPGTLFSPGDIIYLQPKRIRAERGSEIHIAREGETMHSISQLYGVRLSHLLTRNHMQEGQEPSTGDTVFLRKQNSGEELRRNLTPEYHL